MLRFFVKNPGNFSHYPKNERQILMYGTCKFTKKEHRGLFSYHEVVSGIITKLQYTLGSSDTNVKILELSIPINFNIFHRDFEDIRNFQYHEDLVQSFEEYKKLETEFGIAFHEYEEARNFLFQSDYSEQAKKKCGKAKRKKNIAQAKLRNFVCNNQIKI